VLENRLSIPKTGELEVSKVESSPVESWLKLADLRRQRAQARAG
jgi:hypothetical protein